MDTRIKYGDFEPDDRELPYEIFGSVEALQRVEILLSVRRGDFIYDPCLGCDWGDISPNMLTEEELMMYCRTALVGRGELLVTNVHARSGNDRMYIDISMEYNKTPESASVAFPQRRR